MTNSTIETAKPTRRREKKIADQRSTQLVPPRFFARRRASRVLWTWGFVVVVLAATLLGVFVPIWMEGHRVHRENEQSITNAEPLRTLRTETAVTNMENKRRAKWAAWVETAKPDDSLLQTLAVIADKTQPAETEIEIDSIEVQLQLEYPATRKQPPRESQPRLLMNAKAGTSTRDWLERLGNSDRISETGSRPGAGGTVQIYGKPVATRWVP